MRYIWEGKYYYLDAEGNPVKPVNFNITAERKGDDFEGTVAGDEFTKATGETAHVKGFFELDRVEFEVTYPFFWTVNENEKIVVDRNQPGHTVSYFGHLDAPSSAWKGEWEVITEEIPQPEIPNFIETFVVYGLWEMELIQKDQLPAGSK